MWANGTLGYYYGITSGISVTDLVQKPAKKPAQNVKNPPSPQNNLDESSNPSDRANLAELLAPAVEGPPSPQRLRQLNKQMKRASHLRRRQGQRHQATASSASSTTSFNGDLEQALDNMDLVRRSSFQSSDGSNTSRDVAEGLQAFGKSLFHRRGRSKQESVSSSSSLYSADTPTDASSAGPKDSVLPKLFSRRKPSRDDPNLKRLPISGPFNFQHVAHTNRDSPDADVPPPPQGVRGRPRAPSGPDFRYSNVLAEPVDEFGGFSSVPPPRPGLVARHTSGFHGVRRFMKTGRPADLTAITTDQQPPKRPPRPPFDSRIGRSPVPSVPPRFSSRQPSDTVTLDAVVTTTFERPLTSGGFQKPRPFSPASPISPIDQHQSPTRQAFTPPADLGSFSADSILARSLSATPEPAWPLASPTIVNYEAPLPDVPDDEIQRRWSRRSRRASNNSSLRGSHSVPALRRLAQLQHKASGQNADQPRTDQWADQLKTELETNMSNDADLGRASWEDDIDYCYEHEVEADCDYQWDRPSMDVMRGQQPMDTDFVSPTDEALSKAQLIHASKQSPGMPSASGFEVPALSPASQTSTVLGHEAATPTTNHEDEASFPARYDQNGRPLPALKRVGRISCASTFRESRMFTLSPSLLIPQDFKQQLTLTEEERGDQQLGDMSAQYNGLLNVEAPTAPGKPLQQRSSTATTASSYTSNSDSTGERHASTNSSWTALTRYTASTSSLNKLAVPWAETPEPIPIRSPTGNMEEATDEELTPPAAEDVVPELMPAMPPVGRRGFHKSHASESMIPNDAVTADAKHMAKPKRPRARTASLSKQPPPVGQYALFPRSQIRAQGDRI